MAGYGLIFYAVTLWIFDFLDTLPCKAQPTRCRTWIAALWQDHTALFSFAVILLCWLPWLIIFYPAAVSTDSAYQTIQVFGVIPPNSHHPVFSTWLIGGFIKIGRALGSDNLGAFLYVLMQSVISASIYAQIVAYTKKISCPNFVPVSALAFYALFFEFGAFMQTVIKDTLFASLFALFILMTIKFVREPELRLHSWKKVLSYALVSLLICLMRNNGFPLALATFIVLLAFMAFSKLKGKTVVGCCMVIVTAAYFTFNSVSLALIQGTKGSVAEALSIPLQQTARYVRDYGEEVTPEEQSAIDAVLNYEVIGKRYNPQISDLVKNTFRNPDKAALKEYFKVWFQMLLKHPDVYIQATLENSFGYYAFTPPTMYCDNIMYDPGHLKTSRANLDKAGININYVFSDTMKKFCVNMIQVTKSVPLLGQLYSPALYTWLMMISSLYLFIRKKRRLLIVMIPILLLFLACVASPVNGMWRYYMPIVSAAPAVFAAVISVAGRKDTELR